MADDEREGGELARLECRECGAPGTDWCEECELARAQHLDRTEELCADITALSRSWSAGLFGDPACPDATALNRTMASCLDRLRRHLGGAW